MEIDCSDIILIWFEYKKFYKSNTIMQKGKKFAGITQNLNRILTKSLQSFSQNTEWTDINNWLLTLESVLKDYPSPFITQKVLLSKRLNQCMNPVLPQKVHQCVLRIHDIIFSNMKIAADGNINDYIKMFAQDLGTYSISILPYFTHTSVRQQRFMVLKLIKDYYLDLGRQLIPMLSGFTKSLLPVYTEVTDEKLSSQIQKTLDSLLVKAGRRYLIGCIWSSILKFTDCKQAGVKYLARTLRKMDFIKDEEEFSESHGFSEEQEELRLEMLQLQKQQTAKKPRPNSANHSVDDHIVDPRELDTPIENISEKKPDKYADKDKIQQFTIQQAQVSSEQQLNEPKDSQFDKNQQKFIEGIREVKQNDEQSESDENDQVQPLPNGQKKKLKIKSKARMNIFDAMTYSPQTPHSIAQQSNLASTKMFSTSQHFQPSDTIRLNKVPLVTTPGIQTIKQGIDSDRQQNNYPNSNTLVVSALISCLEEDSQIIKRAALDFMFSHLRIKSEILNENDKRLLVEALVGLFKRKEISICKRVNRWLFGKEDEENRYKIHQKNEFVIGYIINAFKKILQKQPTSQQNCAVPIKILQNFYIQHPHLVQLTLGQISINILRYIFNYGTRSEKSTQDSQDFTQQVMKAGKRFLQNLPSYYPIIFKSLGRNYLQAIQKKDSQLCYQAVKYTDFCYINLMKHEHGLEELEYITLTLEAICQGLRILAEQNSYKEVFLKDTILLAYNLVARRDSVQRYNKKALEKVNEKYFEQTGEHELPPQRIQYQKQQQQEQQNQQNRYTDIVQNLQCFFVGLGNFIKAIPNIQAYEETYKVCSMTIVKIQGHLPKKGINELPQWFATIQQGIKLSNPVVSLASIEATVRILMWEQNHPIYNSLKLIIVQQKSKKVGNDYQKLALQKLWVLLDFPHMHSKIIDLIISFSRFFPYEFTETVKRSFTKINTAEKQASIQRFSHFWRLTGFKYKELLVSNRQFGELNKVGLFMMLDFLDDPNPLVRHAAKNWLMESIPLFSRIIEPLLHELVKNCTDWYETPKGVFLIKNVYDTDHVFSTIRRIRSILSNGSFAVLRYIYQTEISENLNELKDKITEQKQPFLTMNSKETPKPVGALIEREPVLPKALEKHLDPVQNPENSKHTKMAYFDLMLILIIKYIEGHAIQSMGVEFYVGNSGVNASAVEFLQTLLDYIDNPTLCRRIIEFILNPLFKVLKQVVTNRQYIMQIQILNILKNIFFSSSFRKKADSQQIRDFFKSVFTNKTFIDSTLQGLNTPFSYVRSQFISFLTICIPLIADFLEPNDCTECIRNIIFNYYRIIKDLRVNVLADVLKEEQEIEDEEFELQNKPKTKLYNRILQLQHNIKKEQKFVKLTSNLSQIAKTNQVLSVLHGISAILNYFFDLNKLNLQQLNFQFTNPYTFFDTFKSIVTLGLASSTKQGKLVERRQFLHNLETCSAILQDLTPVYETILRSWSLSQQYVRISTEEFSSIGMKFFNFEKFESYNKTVKELIYYVQQQKQSIWGKIFSIMQPMYYRFPKQITDIYMKLWIRECQDISDAQGKIKPSSQKTQFLMKIIQTIIVNNFPMHIVIHALLQSSAIQQLNQYYKKQTTSKKGNVLNYQINKKQSKLLFFIYVYFNYVNMNQKEMNATKLLQIWSLIMKVLKPFEKSRSPIVAIWILEIISLGAKKYSPKELLVNEKFKSDLHRLINDKLKFIAAVASRSEKFFFRDPMMKINFNDEQQTTLEQYHLVLPLPPTIYEIYKLKPKERNSTDKEMLKNIRPGDNMELQNKYRLYCFKVLKQLGLQILQNTYLPQKTHWVVVRTNEWLDIILPVIEDKNTHNMIFAQCASQILHDILDRARILFIKTLKPKVLQIFNKDDFFICNPNTLNFWAKIIDWVVSMDRYNQTFTQYLQKVSLSSSYFTSQNLQNKKRIKSFERICFILYSGSKDKYSQRIKGLLQKISQVIKMSQAAHPALLILILFCIRILILRLSEISLNQLFIDIWPMILALLMQIFSKQYVKVNLQNEVSRNPNLLLASLKLIEMISLTNLGEFAHHQWIFIYDYFGIKLTVPEMVHQLNEYYSSRPQLAGTIKVNRATKTPPFIYKPYLINYTPVSSINYTNQKNQQQKIEFAPTKRNLVIKNSFVQDQNELKVEVLVLMQYLNYVNEYRTFVDWEEVENVIVDDFIKLDSFIHEIK